MNILKKERKEKMGELEFLSFLERKKKEEEMLPNLKEVWLETLKDFYDQVKDWLNSAVERGLLTVEDKAVDLAEEDLGEYKAPGLLLSFSKKTIEFRPIGRLVFGAKGRIDIYSDKGIFTLLHDAKHTGWSLLEKASKTQKPFDKEVCLSLLQDLFS